MMPRPSPSLGRAFRPSLLVPLMALAFPLVLLAGCGGEDMPPPVPPLPEAAMAAVAEDPGADREDVARAVDALFTVQGIGRTQALVVMHAGEVVAERYDKGVEPATRFSGWSMSKTVTAVLIGMLVADGRLALDEPAPVPHWQRAGDPRGEITLRHLLQMRSGLRHKEMADPPYESGEVRMMFLDGRDQSGAWAKAQPLEHEPGGVFVYSTPATVILADIATDLLAPDASPAERQGAMADFLRARLAVPLGMDSMVGEYDAAGTLAGGSSIWANARDWARLGEFLRHSGSVRGAQIVPRGWVEFMRQESPRSPDYGGLVWLNRASGTNRQMLYPEQGPDTMFAAIGHLGQYLIVSPSQRLTIVRLGKTDDKDRDALVEKLADLAALYPER